MACLKIDVIGEGYELSGSNIGPARADGGGHEERLAAEELEGVDWCPEVHRVDPFVEVDPPLKADHVDALERAAHQLPRMARDLAPRRVHGEPVCFSRDEKYAWGGQAGCRVPCSVGSQGYLHME